MRRWSDGLKSRATRQLDTDKMHLRCGSINTLRGKHLDLISRCIIDHITEVKLAEGVSNAKVNRLLEVLRAILRRCVKSAGMARPRAAGAHAQRVFPASTFSYSRWGAQVTGRVADSFGWYLSPDYGERMSPTCSGRRWFGAPAGMDLPGSGESAEGDPSSAQRRSRDDPWSRARQDSNPREGVWRSTA